MNLKAFLLASGATGVLWSGCCPASRPGKAAGEANVYRPITPSHSDIVGVWLGMKPGYLYIYRLSLQEGGTGVLAYSFAQDPPQALPVTGWRLDERSIEIKVDASRGTLNPVAIRGSAGIGALRLRIQGADWEQEVAFIKEEEFERRHNELKKKGVEL